jgi:hypothetical protein
MPIETGMGSVCASRTGTEHLTARCIADHATRSVQPAMDRTTTTVRSVERMQRLHIAFQGSASVWRAGLVRTVAFGEGTVTQHASAVSIEQDLVSTASNALSMLCGQTEVVFAKADGHRTMTALSILGTVLQPALRMDVH